MNPLEHVKPQSIRQISKNQVAITIDLTTYRNLQDPLVIQSAMDDYLRRYPNVDSWQATASNGLLTIIVSGTINPDINQFKE